jgi:putative acetyltransferase
MSLRIDEIRSHEIDAAKAVIREVCFEVFGHEPLAFDDMDQVLVQYAAPSGIFLVLRDAEAIVGTGAIRRIDRQTCELKRMWFLPSYRGRGLGRAMVERLLEFARQAGYERVRLDTTPTLTAANRLYQRIGFRPIERYNDGPGTIFMEKSLRHIG